MCACVHVHTDMAQGRTPDFLNLKQELKSITNMILWYGYLISGIIRIIPENKKSKFCFESVNRFYLKPRKKNMLQRFENLYTYIGAYVSEIKEELNKPR